jgi:hypothetical protein
LSRAPSPNYPADASSIAGHTARTAASKAEVTLIKGEAPVRKFLLAAFIFVLAADAAQAVPRNLIYVTDPPYNAACDNATDDTAAIQAAINAVNGSGGQVVIPGACRISSELTITGSVVLSGLNAGTSALIATRIDTLMVHFMGTVNQGGIEKLSVYGYQNTAAGWCPKARIGSCTPRSTPGMSERPMGSCKVRACPAPPVAKPTSLIRISVGPTSNRSL